jgi:GGDEF domain-containing protein
MSDVGRKPAPDAHERPAIADPAVDAAPVAPSALWRRDPAQPLRDPMALVRRERQAAVAQIQRSLAAWRKVGGAPAAPVQRKPFETRDEKNDRAVAALERDLPPERAEAVRALREQTRKLATDAVTGLSSRGVLTATLEDVIAHIDASDDQAFFVSADIKNLGGLNGTFGTSAADRHYHAISDCFMQTLQSALAGARVIGYRLGGDEFGAVVVGAVDHGRVSGAVRAAEAAVAAYVQATVEQRLGGGGAVRLSEVDHPKHPGDPAYRGTGVVVADIQITPKMKPSDALQVMDAVDLRKRASGSAEDGATMAALQPPPANADRAPQQPNAQPQQPNAQASADRQPARADVAATPRSPTTNDSTPAAKDASRFASGAERNDAQIAQLVAQLPPEQAAPLRALQQTNQRLTTDAVTGLASRGMLAATLEDVIRFLHDSDEQACFVSADIKNLGGLNGTFGTSAADRHYRAMSDCFMQTLRSTLGGARVIGYRLGGDEFGAIVVGQVDGGRVHGAVAAADGAVRAYVESARDRELASGREVRLADLEHPKHRGDAAYRGTGVVTADIQILPTMTPDNVLSVMDAVDLKKRGDGGT